MRTVSPVLALVLSFSVSGLASTQIATVTSNGPFQLRGANVSPGPGVPSWPVMPGDTIQAGGTLLTLTFADGSTVVLPGDSLATVSLRGATPLITLQANAAAHYTLKTPTSVALECKDGTAASQSPAGDMDCGSSHRRAGWWIAAAAAGGGTALGVWLKNRNGQSVSPSR